MDRHGVVPTYAIDFPVANSPEAVSILRSIADDGRCEIGAHLHPWVSPPIEEEVNVYNSFPGNLPPPLEREKLARLADRIEKCVRLPPDCLQSRSIWPRTGHIPNTPPVRISGRHQRGATHRFFCIRRTRFHGFSVRPVPACADLIALTAFGAFHGRTGGRRSKALSLSDAAQRRNCACPAGSEAWPA